MHAICSPGGAQKEGYGIDKCHIAIILADCICAVKPGLEYHSAYIARAFQLTKWQPYEI